MRILADENAPRASCRVLRDGGHDVEHIADIERGAVDQAVLVRATSSGRTLVTFDLDFGRLVTRRRIPAPQGVILLRFTPSAPEEAGVVLSALLAKAEITFAGHITVIDRDSVRQRPVSPSHAG